MILEFFMLIIEGSHYKLNVHIDNVKMISFMWNMIMIYMFYYMIYMFIYFYDLYMFYMIYMFYKKQISNINLSITCLL